MPYANVYSYWKNGVLRFAKKSDKTTKLFIGPNGIGRPLTRVDADEQNTVVTVAIIKSGLLVHTSVTGGGTLTLPTAELMLAGFPDMEIGEVITFEYLNDGDQTVTLTGDTDMTRLSAQTIATLQGRTIFIQKTSSTAFICWAS
jgi:hypothetical protein